MRRRIPVVALAAIVIFLIQTTIISQIPVSFIQPNIILIFVVSYGFMRGRKGGMIVGFACGMLLDLFYGHIFGFHGLIYLLIGYLNGTLYKVFFDEDLKVPIILVGLSDFAYGIIYYLFLFALRTRYSFGAFLRYTIMPEVISSMLFTIIIYKLFMLINRRLSAYELEEQQSPWLGK